MAHESSGISATERLRIAAQAAHLAVWEWQRASDELHWSGDVAGLLCCSEGEVPARLGTFLRYLHDHDRATVQRLVEAALAGAEQRVDVTCRLRADESRWVRCTAEVRFDETGAARIVGTIADVSDLKSLEAQLRQAQKMESMGQLAGGIAHDFNNVLTVILGEAQCSRLHDGLRSATRTSLGNIENAAHRGQDLTRQLLTFARHQTVQVGAIEFSAFLRELAPMLRRLAGDGVRLEVSVEQPLEPVRADRSQLEQVVMNLVVNAKEAMRGQGRIEITAGQLERAPAPSPGHAPPSNPAEWLEVFVADTGPGISRSARDRLFEPFYTTKLQGTGLGLSTSRGIVRQCGGDLVLMDPIADGSQASGATFRILLPCLHARAVDGAPRTSRSESQAGGDGDAVSDPGPN